MIAVRNQRMSGHRRAGDTVCAIVVTHHRTESLREWLVAIEAQTRRPDQILVVDNGTDGKTAAMLREEFPDVCCVTEGRNLGAAGGAALGLKTGCDFGHTWFLMCDDDSYPDPAVLEKALGLADQRSDRNPGLIWVPSSDFGGWLWKGRKVPVSVAAMAGSRRESYEVDNVDLNMTLVSRDLVDRIGLPRADYFIMMWGTEYSLRAKGAGFSIWVLPEILVRHENAGSTGGGTWRLYYQSRNHLALALERRSPRELFWCLARQARFMMGALVRQPEKGHRLKLRLRGLWDGLRGALGPTLLPENAPRNPVL